MVISWLIMSVAYSLAIWRFFLSRTEIPAHSRFIYAFCFLSLGLSLVQYENWLWALQVDFFLTQAFVIQAAIFVGINSLGNGTRSLLVALCARESRSRSGYWQLRLEKKSAAENLDNELDQSVQASDARRADFDNCLHLVADG